MFGFNCFLRVGGFGNENGWPGVILNSGCEVQCRKGNSLMFGVAQGTAVGNVRRDTLLK